MICRPMFEPLGLRLLATRAPRTSGPRRVPKISVRRLLVLGAPLSRLCEQLLTLLTFSCSPQMPEMWRLKNPENVEDGASPGPAHLYRAVRSHRLSCSTPQGRFVGYMTGSVSGITSGHGLNQGRCRQPKLTDYGDGPHELMAANPTGSAAAALRIGCFGWFIAYAEEARASFPSGSDDRTLMALFLPPVPPAYRSG